MQEIPRTEDDDEWKWRTQHSMKSYRRPGSIMLEERDGEILEGYLIYAVKRTASILNISDEEALEKLKTGTKENPVEIGGISYWNAKEDSDYD